jgi:glycosyltransferase A (GT-A) superfamily protein (DUF2064 family)
MTQRNRCLVRAIAVITMVSWILQLRIEKGHFVLKMRTFYEKQFRDMNLGAGMKTEKGWVLK